MSLSSILAQHGFTVDQAREAVASLVSDPQQLYSALVQYRIPTAVAAELAGVSDADVKAFFGAHGIDASQLDTFGADVTDLVFLSDLHDGDIYVYNPWTGEGEELFSFGRGINDIAVAPDGDIYGIDFSGVYRFDWQTQTVSQVAQVNNEWRGLVIHENYIGVGGLLNGTVDIYDLTNAQHVLSLAPDSAQQAGFTVGDLAVVGGVLYRTTSHESLARVDVPSGETVRVANLVQYGFDGLTGTPDGDVLAFQTVGRVRAYDPDTGAVSELDQVVLLGLSTVSGAAEVLQTHLYDIF